MFTKRLPLIPALIALLCMTGGVAFAAPTGPSVTGSGTVVLPSGFPVPAFVGDHIQVELSARALPNGGVQGEFSLHHHSANGGLVAELHGKVTCLTIAGNRANATGVIGQGKLFENPTFNPAGQTAAVSVVDDSPDRLGFDLSFFPTPHAIATCQPAPLLLPLKAGNFTIHG
jgi:hypothetical protein